MKEREEEDDQWPNGWTAAIGGRFEGPGWGNVSWTKSIY